MQTAKPIHLALGLSATLIAACGSEDSPPPVQTDPVPLAVERIVEDRIVPAMTAFADEARALEESIDSACPSPGEAQVDEWQAHYLTMREHWAVASCYNLGPLDDDLIIPSVIFIESMRLRGTDYTETVREHVAMTLASDEPLDDAFFDDLSFKNIGILALEVLLFEDTTEAHTTSSSTIAAEYAANPRKCTYAKAVSRRLADRAERVATGWTTEYKDTGKPFSEHMKGEALEDGSVPAQALLLAVFGHIDYLEKRKVNAILDLRIATASRPEARPFYAGLETMVDEVEVLFATYSAEGHTFADIIGRRGFVDEIASLRADIETMRASTGAEDRDATSTSIAVLRDSLAVLVPDALGVYLGVNFSDGD